MTAFPAPLVETVPSIDNFDTCALGFDSHTGEYPWIWRVLRWRAKRTGFPPLRLYPIAKHFFNPAKPFFKGETADGILFMGDHRDRYALDRMVEPGVGDMMADFILARMVVSGGDFLDIGTNLGMVAARVARKLGPDAEVVAFEAMPDTAKRAAATFGLNGLQNVRLFPVALGDGDGEITFYNSPGNSDFASANPADFDIKGVDVVWSETKVPCFRLDTLMRNGSFGRVGLIKIDVEGNEMRILQGAQQLIERDRPAIVFEYNFKIAPSMGWSVADVDALLNAITPYRLRALYDDGTLRDLPSALVSAGWMKVDIYCEPI